MTHPDHKNTSDFVLDGIRSYCSAMGISVSTFGLRAVNDGKLVKRIESGGRMTTDTVDRINRYMANNPPVGAQPTAAAE